LLKKDYKGSIRNLKTEENFEECFISIFSKDNKPKKVELFIEDSILETKKILEGELEINTVVEKIYVWNKRSSTRTNSYRTKITLYPEEVFIITQHDYLEDLSSDNIKVFIQLTNISYFDHSLGWFEFEAFENLKNIKTISEKYTHDVPKFLNECKFYPWITKIKTDKKRTNKFDTFMWVEFVLKSTKTGLELFTEIKEKIDLLLRVLNFVNDGFADYKQIRFNYLNEGEKYSCKSIKNVKNKNGFNSYGISTAEYLNIVNHILGEVMFCSEEKLNRFLVLATRHNKFKGEVDISIKVALIHTTLLQLIQYFDIKHVDLSLEKKIIEILTKLDITYNSRLIEDLIKFNKSRNEIFKNIKLDFKYDNKFNQSIIIALNLMKDLFIKFFQIENEELRSSFSRLYNYVYIKNIKFDFIEEEETSN
jgi:hypothetical protein